MNKDLTQRKFVVSDEVLSKQPCEVVFAMAVTDGNAPDGNFLYDGIDTSGEKVIELSSGVAECVLFAPPEPVSFYKGLFVDMGTNTTGIFIMWRLIPK